MILTMAKILKIVDKGVALLCDSIMMVAGTAVVLLIMAGAFLRYVLKILAILHRQHRSRPQPLSSECGYGECVY